MCALTDGVMMGFIWVCALFDLKMREIPIWVLLLFSGATVVSTLFGGQEVRTIVIGFFIGCFFLVLSKVTKEAMGYGDSWIITLLGIYLGAEKLLWTLFIASFLAALASLYQMWKQNWDRTGSLPFVPFLAVGAAGVIYL